MVARATLAEVDTVRMSMDQLVEVYRDSVVPAMEEQQGYEGFYLLTTPEGKAMALTFWESEAAAEAGVTSGYYSEQVEKFVTVFRAPAGRETYEVTLADAPEAAIV